jgi:hypothetical protein
MIARVRNAGPPTPFKGSIRMEPRRFLRAILNTTLGVLAVAGQIAMAAPTHGQPDADAADRDLERPPSWSIPSYSEVRRRMNGWLDAVALADQARKDEIAAVREAWPEQQPVDPAAVRQQLLDLIH